MILKIRIESDIERSPSQYGFEKHLDTEPQILSENIQKNGQTQLLQSHYLHY